MITMHYQKHIELAPDVGPITDSERDDFRDKIIVWFTALQALCVNKLKLREVRHYDVGAAPGDLMGAPKKINVLNMLGTGASEPLPPQNAASITFKTDVRKHWGRIYFPGLTVAHTDNTGRLETTACDDIMDASASLCSRGGTGAHLVVFSRTLWEPQDVTEVQVDDVTDVIRSRRFSSTHYRAAASP